MPESKEAVESDAQFVGNCHLVRQGRTAASIPFYMNNSSCQRNNIELSTLVIP